MSFVYVDRITEFEPGKYIRGIKNTTRNESFYYWLPDGRRALSPAVLLESKAQLGAMLVMHKCDFNKRPVLLADERSEYYDYAESGQSLEVYMQIDRHDEDVIVSSGYTAIDGKKLTENKCTRSYLLPMDDFADRNQVKKEFDALMRPLPEKMQWAKPIHQIKPFAGVSSFESLRFIDGLIEHKPNEKVVGYKNITRCEAFFDGHFPYRPIVPGVMLTTFMGEICQYLTKEDINGPLRTRALIPNFIENVRFRKFVEPGDQCIVEAKLLEGDCFKDDQQVMIQGKIFANNNRVMQCRMGFKTMVRDGSN